MLSLIEAEIKYPEQTLSNVNTASPTVLDTRMNTLQLVRARARTHQTASHPPHFTSMHLALNSPKCRQLHGPCCARHLRN